MNSAKEIIKFYEGFKDKAYYCSAGKVTIGYGTTFYYPSRQKVKITDRITREQAEWQLDQHIENLEKEILGMVTVKINDNQLGALVSFAYNVGLDKDEDAIAEGFGDSTLLKKLNAGDFQGAANEFNKWVYATDSKTGKKIKLNGLVKRRKTESELFLKI
jgi:lysozyme